MKHQAFRPVAVMLSVLLATVVPARAGSIHFTDVMQAIVDSQNGRAKTELRLRSITQSGRQQPASGVTPQQPSGSATTTTTVEAGDSDASATSSNLTTTSLPSVEISQDGTTSGQVQTVDLGDITGTVCDCGEIPLPPGGSFPKWPFLALAAIPLFFLGGGENPPDIPDTPDVPNQPIPEPATLLLFGTSLLALGARGRRRRHQHDEDATAAAVAKVEEEV